MTDETLTELEGLLEQAGVGRLVTHEKGCCGQIFEDGVWCVATVLSTEDENYTCGEGRTPEAAQALQALIVAAVNTLPTLIERLKEQERDLDTARAAMRLNRGLAEHARARCERLETALRLVKFQLLEGIDNAEPYENPPLEVRDCRRMAAEIDATLPDREQDEPKEASE